MEIEKNQYSEAVQQKIIDEILALSDVGIITKAFKLKNHDGINRNFIYEYLESKKLNLIKELTTDHPEAKMPSAKSASEWKRNEELEYYGIQIIEANEKTMFGEEVPLADSVKEFLDIHSDSFLKSYGKEIKAKKVIKPSAFATNLYYYWKERNLEANIDNVILYFLANVFDKDFTVRSQAQFSLFVMKCEKCVAKTDICVVDNIIFTSGVIVCEDKSIFNQKGDPLAQLIAQAIAVAQQPDWEEKWPVYMVLSVGLELKFYKAFFTKKFLENVRDGWDNPNKTKVFHLEEEPADLISLETEIGRMKAAKIFARIQEDLRRRRNY